MFLPNVFRLIFYYAKEISISRMNLVVDNVGNKTGWNSQHEFHHRIMIPEKMCNRSQISF